MLSPGQLPWLRGIRPYAALQQKRVLELRRFESCVAVGWNAAPNGQGVGPRQSLQATRGCAVLNMVHDYTRYRTPNSRRVQLVTRTALHCTARMHCLMQGASVRCLPDVQIHQSSYRISTRIHQHTLTSQVPRYDRDARCRRASPHPNFAVGTEGRSSRVSCHFTTAQLRYRAQHNVTPRM